MRQKPQVFQSVVKLFVALIEFLYNINNFPQPLPAGQTPVFIISC